MAPCTLFRAGLIRAALTFLCFTLAGAARANDAAVKPAHKPHPAIHGRAKAAAPAPSLDQIRSELFHGSAAQQEMERNDNDRASRKPVDHTKDEFFSDWKGLK